MKIARFERKYIGTEKRGVVWVARDYPIGVIIEDEKINVDFYDLPTDTWVVLKPDALRVRIIPTEKVGNLADYTAWESNDILDVVCSSRLLPKLTLKMLGTSQTGYYEMPATLENWFKDTRHWANIWNTLRLIKLRISQGLGLIQLPF